MIQVHVLRDGREVDEPRVQDLSEVRTEPGTLIWVDLVSPTAEELAGVAAEFDIHELALEDVQVGQAQRPKVLIRLGESVEDYQDLTSGALDANATMASNRVNTVARNLAAWAAIFAVITMISGIYGMNFDHIPSCTGASATPGRSG
jgi:Mg2+ and Co2+ transporter CorA